MICHDMHDFVSYYKHFYEKKKKIYSILKNGINVIMIWKKYSQASDKKLKDRRRLLKTSRVYLRVLTSQNKVAG